MSPSLLDLKFVALLSCIGFLRLFWPNRHYALLGLASSGLLLWFSAPLTVLVISAITLLVLYPIHRLTRTGEERGWAKKWTRWVLPAGIAVLVSLLIVFKLHRYISLPALGTPWGNAQMAALVGFSYFVFRAIDFLHIQSILRFKETSPVPLLYYTLFPSTITSGPIQKYQDFRLQLGAPAPLTLPLIGTAAYRITRGYFRKIVLAVALNEMVVKVLARENQVFLSSLLVIVLLYLYFYFDFAGYSDIAIGFGLLLGIKVPENFRRPFHATNISEFWRNWHITLVDWFRDHVFIPLGGMQSSRQYAAGLAVFIMVLCGLWHGIAWPLLIWGAWHGAWLCIEALTGSKPVPPARRHGPRYWTRVVWTNARVAIVCILFLPNTETMLKIFSGFAKLW